MAALREVWRIADAGSPPRPLPEGEQVRNVEGFCRDLIRRLTSHDPLPWDDEEQLLAELFERVLVLTRAYDPSRRGIVFRAWLHTELRRDAIDYLRSWRGRRGEKALVDGSAGESALRDSGLADGDPRVDRLDGALTAGEGDCPQDRTSALEWLYAGGDRATLREERRMGLGASLRAQGGNPRAGALPLAGDARRAQGGDPGTHWRDCPACGWRNFRNVGPNGLPGWQLPERCLACGTALGVETIGDVA